eukprot:gene6073-10081_t
MKKTIPKLSSILYEKIPEEASKIEIKNTKIKIDVNFNLIPSMDTVFQDLVDGEPDSLERTNFAFQKDKDEIFIHGGIRNGEELNDLRSYNIFEKQWYNYKFKHESDENYSPKMSNHHMFIVNNSLFLLNGTSIYFQLDDYKTSNRCWNKKKISGFNNVNFSSYVSQFNNSFLSFKFFQHKMTISSFYYVPPSNLIQYSDCSTVESKKLFPSKMGAVTIGPNVYFFGGQYPDGRLSNDLFRYNMKNKCFKELEIDYKPPALHSTSLFSLDYDQQLFVSGGILESGKISKEIYQFDIYKNEWKIIQMNGNQPVFGHKILAGSSVPGESSSFIFLGGISENNIFCDNMLLRNIMKCSDTDSQIEYMEHIQNDEDFHDVGFVTDYWEDDPIFGNRIFLSKRCSYFNKLIKQNGDSDRISIHDCSRETLEYYITFLYTGKIIMNEIINRKEFLNILYESNNKELFVNIFNCENSIEISSSIYRKLKNDLVSYFGEISSSDFQLKTTDSTETFYVHKMILSRSTFFKKFFRHKMIEYKEKKMKLINITQETLKIVLHYLYFNEVIDIPVHVAMDLLSNSLLFELDNLVEKSEKIVAENIDEENIFDLISIAEVYDLRKLINKCNMYCCKNYDQLDSSKISNSLKLTYCSYFKLKTKVKAKRIIE